MQFNSFFLELKDLLRILIKVNNSTLGYGENLTWTRYLSYTL